MKAYDELKVETETIQQQMAEAKKNVRASSTQRSTFVQRVYIY